MLQTNRGVSTMHYLNVVAGTHQFLTLRPPLVGPTDWMFEDAALALAMDSIYFVTELTEYVPRSGDPQEAARYMRTAVRMRLSDFLVDGFVHVPHGSNPIQRLNQVHNPFIALTVVSVMGPEEQFATSFLAANRRYVSAFQQIIGELQPPKELSADEHART
jgi:hypothetical protein